MLDTKTSQHIDQRDSEPKITVGHFLKSTKGLAVSVSQVADCRWQIASSAICNLLSAMPLDRRPDPEQDTHDQQDPRIQLQRFDRSGPDSWVVTVRTGGMARGGQ